MDIQGCGKVSDNLTFYEDRGKPKSAERKTTRLVCGQHAETLSGGRGVLLCAKCAGGYGFQPFRKARSV
jgi:hypothetical protein